LGQTTRNSRTFAKESYPTNARPQYPCGVGLASALWRWKKGIELAKKFYVVWAGRKTGVFTDWATTQQYVDKFPGARFKSFGSLAEADQAFRAGKPAYVRALPATAKPGIPASTRIHSATEGLQIYCDGACEPNPGRAGSGIAVYRDGTLVQLWYGLYNPNGTNNTAELNALYHALLIAEAAIDAGETAQILCDSTYSINCVSKWAVGWEKKGWRKAGGEIKNLAIIQTAYELYARIESQLQLIHVSAHVGTEGNELADRMAMFAVESGSEDLRLYGEEMDVKAILRMRAG
jgi:ribonuclease HI